MSAEVGKKREDIDKLREMKILWNGKGKHLQFHQISV